MWSGVHVENDGFFETELVPPFIKTHFNYTAMIPHNTKDIKMKIIKQGTDQVTIYFINLYLFHKCVFHQEVLLHDESCSINEELNWKERRESTMVAEVTLNSNIKHCSLEVSSFGQHTSDCFIGG